MTENEHHPILSGRARLFIATQAQPIEIVRLSREDRALGLSVMCVNGTEEQTQVSRDYNGFVRRPAGLIERLYGHDSFRMDVDPDIGSGSSWQLGALLAHALENKQRLLCRLDEPDGTEDILVWATGAVRVVDMAVQPVGHVAEKLAVSMEMFRQARDAGIQCLVFLPAANMDAVSQQQRDQLAAMQIELHGLEDARQAFKHLQLQVPMLRERGVEGGQGGKILPYPGLRAYGPGERDMFFGRNRARTTALERLRRNAAQGCGLLVIHGRSGSGKSSFVLAGLAGDVVEQAHEGGHWRIAVAQFSEAEESAGQAIIRALSESLELSGDALEPFIADMSADPAAALEKYLQQGIAQDGKRSLLLVLDQFEQVFSTEGAPETLGALDTLIDQLLRSGRVWAVLTMRTDQLERLERLPQLARHLDDTRLFWLQAPDLSELNEIIGRPAQLAGYRFETGTDGVALLDTLAEKAIQSPESLPLLQIVLSRLVDFAGAEKLLSFAALERIGGFEGAIAQWAEQAIAQLKQRDISDGQIARILASLVRPAAEGEQFLSRPARIGDGGAGNDRRGEIIAHLVVARLLTTEAGPEGASARLAHESLIRSWPRLAQLVADVRQSIVLRDRLEIMAHEYRQSGQESRLLLRDGVRLALARDLIEQGVVELDGETQAYIERSAAVLADEQTASREAEAAHRRATEERARLAQRLFRRTAIGVGAAAVLAVLAGGAAFLAVEQFERASSREGTALALLAQTRVETDPIGAVKLSLAARALDNRGVSAPITEAVYTKARDMLRTDIVLHHPSGMPAHGVAFSPSGGHVAVRYGSSAVVYDTHSGEILGETEAEDTLAGIAFNAADQLVLLTVDATVSLWDAVARPGAVPTAGLALLAGQEAMDASAKRHYQLSLSRDGSRIVGVDDDNHAFLWNSANGSLIANTASLGSPSVLSPDGRYLVFSYLSRFDEFMVHDWEAGYRSGEIYLDGADPSLEREVVFVDGQTLALPSVTMGSGFDLFGIDGEQKGSVAVAVPSTEPFGFALNDRSYVASTPDNTVVVGPIDRLGVPYGSTATVRLDAAVLSPDGRKTALIDNGSVRIIQNYPYQASDVTSVALAHAEGIEAVSGDAGIALVRADRQVVLRDTGTGENLAALALSDGVLTDSHFAADGSSVTVLFTDTEAKSLAVHRFVRSAGGWTAERVLAREFDGPSPLLGARLTADGTLVLFARDHQTINRASLLATIEIASGRTTFLGDSLTEIVALTTMKGHGSAESDLPATIDYDPDFGILLPGRITELPGSITQARLIAEDRYLLAYGPENLWGIDVQTGEILGRYVPNSVIHSITPAAESGQILVVEGDGSVFAWTPDFLHYDKDERICRYLPLVNGERDLDLGDLAADIGIASLPDIGPCP